MAKKNNHIDERAENGVTRKSKTKSADKFTVQGRPKVRTGSTTQGGSNFGQGSMHLGSHANKQGSKKNEGSNYENEQGFDI